MQADTRVLVVGTTADYIDWIRNSCPGNALFLTDHGVRHGALEPCPEPAEEILSNLSNEGQTCRTLRKHLHDYGLRLDGVVCYDCESMELAAVIARKFGLTYPSLQAVRNCRDKFRSKTLWRAQGLKTPRVKLIRSALEAADFFRELGHACVLKPLSGSGSELIFRCEDTRACERGFLDIQQGLQQRRENRLYKSYFSDDPAILAEALVDGDEYSCDFMLQTGHVEVVRLTRKILSPHGPFGTALGYLLLDELPTAMDEDDFLQTLASSANTLGLERAFCMMDFIVHQGQIFLLELAPRPGGDCLPFLLRRCRHLDVLKLFLDFSRCRPSKLNSLSSPRPCIGLRIHAVKNGTLRTIDIDRLQRDRRVCEVHLTRRAGHRINMPPQDYDSWILGHIIFTPDRNKEIESQCRELLEKLVVQVEP